MVRMRALDRKLLRDLWHLRGQVLAIGLVVACGVAVFVTTRTAYDSLEISRARFLTYSHLGFRIVVRLTILTIAHWTSIAPRKRRLA